MSPPTRPLCLVKIIETPHVVIERKNKQSLDLPYITHQCKSNEVAVMFALRSHYWLENGR